VPPFIFLGVAIFVCVGTKGFAGGLVLFNFQTFMVFSCRTIYFAMFFYLKIEIFMNCWRAFFRRERPQNRAYSDELLSTVLNVGSVEFYFND
jgi:hypothetical protein